MSFAKDVWDGVDRVAAHVELQLAVVKDIAGMAAKRAKYEEDYAKHVAELGRQLPGGKAPAAARTEKTMRAAIEAVVACTASVAEPHREMAGALVSQVVKPLEAFAKVKEAERKRLAKEGERKTKALRDLEANAKKAHDVYEKSVGEAKKASELEKKARADLTQNAGVKKYEAAVPKAAANKKKAVERMLLMERTAQVAVENVNTCMSKLYDEEMPEILNVCAFIFLPHNRNNMQARNDADVYVCA